MKSQSLNFDKTLFLKTARERNDAYATEPNQNLRC